VPVEVSLGHGRDEGPPIAYVYRLFDQTRPADSDAAEAFGAFGGLRRWLSRPGPGQGRSVGPASAATKWEGQMDVAELAAIVGRPIPVWLDDTATAGEALGARIKSVPQAKLP
jgi:hypothetical protein